MGVQVTNGQTYEHHGGPLVVYADSVGSVTATIGTAFTWVNT